MARKETRKEEERKWQWKWDARDLENIVALLFCYK